MPFIPVLNGATMEMRYTWQGEQVESVVGLVIPTNYNMNAFATLAANVVADWNTIVKPVTHTSCALRELYFTDQQSDSGSTFTFSTGLPSPGAATGDSMPNNCSCAISFRTPFRGRSYRGRNYPPGLPEEYASNNRVTSAWQNAWLQFYAALFGRANDNSTPLGVISRYSGGLPRTQGQITPITAILYVDNVIDSQRRRLPGRGN